jgi:hypothetical protein
VIVLVNGAFGVGKTTVARRLVARLPRAVLYDPELIGIALQRITRVDDFQDLALWRRLTVLGIRVMRFLRPNVVVPMAFSNVAYLEEIRAGISRFEPHVLHVCLIAPVGVVHERLLGRGDDRVKDAWGFRRAAECCVAHQRPEFATHIDAADRDPEAIAEEIRSAALESVTSSKRQPSASSRPPRSRS